MKEEPDLLVMYIPKAVRDELFSHLAGARQRLRDDNRD